MFDNSANAAIKASSYEWIDSGFSGGLLALVVMVVALMFVKQTGVIGAGLGSKALGLMQKYGTDLAKRGVRKAGYASKVIPQAKALGQRYKQWNGPQISLGKDKEGKPRYANLKIGGRTWFNKEYREGVFGMRDVKALSNPIQLGLAKAEMQKQALAAAKYIKDNLGVGNGEDADNLLKSKKYMGDNYMTLGLLHLKAADKEYEGKPEEYTSDIKNYLGSQDEMTQNMAEDVIRGVGKAGGDRLASVGHRKIEVDQKTGKMEYEKLPKDWIKQTRKALSNFSGARAIMENYCRVLLKNNFKSEFAVEMIGGLMTSPGKIETLAKDNEGKEFLKKAALALADFQAKAQANPDLLKDKKTAFGDDGKPLTDENGNELGMQDIGPRLSVWIDRLNAALNQGAPKDSSNKGTENKVPDDLLKRMQELKSKEAVIREAAASDEYKDKTAFTASNGEEIKYPKAVDLDFKDLHDYLDKLATNPSALSEDQLRDAEKMYETYQPLYNKGGSDKESKDNKSDEGKEDKGSEGNKQNNGEGSGASDLEQALHALAGSNEQLKNEFVNSVNSLKKTYGKNQDFTKTADDFKAMYTKLDAIKMILWKIKTSDKKQENVFRNLGAKLDKIVLAAKATEETGKDFEADIFDSQRSNFFESHLTDQGLSQEDFEQVVQEINDLKAD